jgi:hypothetical protein
MASKLPWYTLIVGIIVLVGFGWLCFYMVDASANLPKDEQFRWDHLVVIFNSIQTMAAAALGVLLGTTVQQARVDAAKSKADAAEAKADANAQHAVKNDAVRSIIAGAHTEGVGAADPAATLRAIQATLAS